jgi:sec-independent protein translocase protein TatC
MDTPNRLVAIINDLRKTILFFVFALMIFAAGFYLLSDPLLALLQNHLDQKLAFFTVAGPFLAHLKISLAMALLVLMPWFVYIFWRAMLKAFTLSRGHLIWFTICTTLLFYAGTSFCYFVTLPYGVKFLLGFQSEQLRPVISINSFVSFVGVFMLAFGVIFELPIFMVFGAKTGIIPRRSFEKNRRYAILAISIVAALLTPTPDVVNMLLMGVPLYLLYELGIITLKMLRVS